ncbi:PepSY domain-containing protein [Bradyrhizobium liaoningense]|uniref:PepSY domain-containing protein n=1 Tax=Bradyrhizobium liaoningense TaxID=43992 RepID=UPI001BA9B732|nr:PepSY domain-containing protein [Bradyrhizobium liaoningense]MBR0711022.1 PepSY domain-containing protein [Bradyrhizobium liaoningense]
MRSFILPAIVAIGLGSAAPAMAYDTGDQVSMQVALDVAADLGVMTVSHTQFLGDEWQIEGRDRAGRWMEVDVDARTGEVRNVDRGW